MDIIDFDRIRQQALLIVYVILSSACFLIDP